MPDLSVQDLRTEINDEDLKTPNIPVDVYLQEAENLYVWCSADREKLTGAGLDWAMVEAIPERTAVLRRKEADWFAERHTSGELRKELNEFLHQGSELRDKLLHAMSYAFRHDPGLLAVVSKIREGRGNADLVQDLNDIAVLGRNNKSLLQKINFDVRLLDKSAELSGKLADVLAAAVTDDNLSEAKRNRDRAYTFLKQAVDEIRACGQYVFRQDKERLKGYSSSYKRRTRTKSRKVVSEQEDGGEE